MYGGSGGTNGGDGDGVENSNKYYSEGGVGSGFDISELQTYFKWFVFKQLLVIGVIKKLVGVDL